MNDYTKKSLLDDGIREDSVFFEYVGRMRDLSDLAEYILQKATGRASFERRASELLELVTDIHDIRFNHFVTLTEKHAVVDIFDRLSDGSRYTDAVTRIDKEIEDAFDELKFSLNNNRDIDAMRTFDQVKAKLQRLKGMDQHLYERANARINRTFDKFSPSILTAPRGVPLVNNSYAPPFYNVDFLRNPPSQGVPASSQSPFTPRQAPQYYQPQQVENIAQENSPPQHSTHTPPIMHQVGANRTPVRNRKKKKMPIKQLAKLTLATGACILGLAAFNNLGHTINTPAPSVPFVPTMQPQITEQGTMPSAYENLLVAPMDNQTIETTQIETPTPTVTQAPTSTPTVFYEKGTLMYCLQYMDDEMVSVVAESFRNSIVGCNGLQISMYGNGCNLAFENDREYVAHVFGILDSRAASMRYSSNYDKFGIAPQMEQVSGDVSRYLISKAISESGKYDKNSYLPEDVDLYYIVSYGKATEFDARTVKTKNGTLVEDELIGRKVHFNGPLRTLLTGHCTLNAAIHGGHMDKGTGRRTQCAYGTQEGDIIDSTSLQVYDSLVTILSSDYELNVPNPGKGVRIVFDKEYER